MSWHQSNYICNTCCNFVLVISGINLTFFFNSAKLSVRLILLCRTVSFFFFVFFLTFLIYNCVLLKKRRLGGKRMQIFCIYEYTNNLTNIFFTGSFLSVWGNNCLEVLLLEEDLADVLVVDPVQDVLLAQGLDLLVRHLKETIQKCITLWSDTLNKETIQNFFYAK